MNVAAALTPSVTAPLRAEWRPLAALDTIADAWRSLADRALEPNIFYEPAFALPAASVFGKNIGAGLVWSHADRLVGFFPARIERRYGLPLPVLTGWTHPYAPLGTPLVDCEMSVPALAAWLDHIAGDPTMPSVMLLPFVPDGPFAAALASLVTRTCGFGHHRRAVLAPGDDRAHYIEGAIGAKKRKELRRQRHRLAEAGAVTVGMATQPGAIGEALADFLRLEAAGWKGRAGTAATRNEPVRRFIESAVAGLAAEGKARIDRLHVGASAVAAAVTLRSGQTAWTWKIAYDETFARASPGVQLMLDLSEALLADDSIARVDSCATPDHPMIDHLWRERLLLRDHLIEIRPSPIAFALACRLEGLRRAAISTAKMLRERSRR
jgi:CelD/BcsL family acetyltransferase involved in cellulose biosynthesis